MLSACQTFECTKRSQQENIFLEDPTGTESSGLLHLIYSSLSLFLFNLKEGTVQSSYIYFLVKAVG